MRARWQQQAARLGFGQAELRACLHRAGPPLPVSMLGLLEGLLGPGGLAAWQATFTRREVIQAICQHLPAGATVDEILRLADRLLAQPEVITEVGWQPDGQAIGDAGLLPGDARRNTTHAHLKLEARLLAAAGQAQPTTIVVPTPVISAALAEHDRQTGRPLDADQQQMVRALAGSGNPVAVVDAAAGSGKTTALGVARQCWEQTGARVIGAALAARAASQLTAGSGIPATTITRLLGDLDRGRRRLDPRTVLVIDEAGMVGTPTLGRLVAHTAQAGAKLVLVGDGSQVPEIEAGGAFAHLAAQLGAIRLAGNHRQRACWERHALALLRAGRLEAALAAYRRHHRLTTRSTPQAACRALVTDWWQHTRTHPTADGTEGVLMLATRRSDVDHLNHLARQHLQRAGRLRGEPLTIHGQPFAVGEHIVTLRNDYHLGVLNGTRATITHIKPHTRTLQVRTSDGRSLRLPHTYLTPAPGQPRRIDYAYATTTHKAQGHRPALPAAGHRQPHPPTGLHRLEPRPARQPPVPGRKRPPPHLDDIEAAAQPRRHPVHALHDQLTRAGDKHMALAYLHNPQPTEPEPASPSLDLTP